MTATLQNFALRASFSQLFRDLEKKYLTNWSNMDIFIFIS